MKLSPNRFLNSFYISVCFWVLTSELINILEMAQAGNSYKLGISILWGLYSLFLIVIGIWRQNQSLRIGAFSLFECDASKIVLL